MWRLDYRNYSYKIGAYQFKIAFVKNKYFKIVCSGEEYFCIMVIQVKKCRVVAKKEKVFAVKETECGKYMRRENGFCALVKIYK